MRLLPAPPRRLILYGSLRRSQPGFGRLGLGRALAFVRPVRIPGRLHDLGDYPGLAPGRGRVMGELYAVLDPGIFGDLDAFEGVRPGDERPFDRLTGRGSLYRRVAIRLPGGPAAVYVINLPTAALKRAPLVRGGDWLGCRRARRSSAFVLDA